MKVSPSSATAELVFELHSALADKSALKASAPACVRASAQDVSGFLPFDPRDKRKLEDLASAATAFIAALETAKSLERHSLFRPIR